MDQVMKSHEEWLSDFLRRCKEKGIVLNNSKFEVHVPTVVFMGHVVGPDSVWADFARFRPSLTCQTPLWCLPQGDSGALPSI